MRGKRTNACGSARSALGFAMVGVGTVAGLAGCEQIPAGFDSPEPAARIEAATIAAELKDIEKIPDLIALLDSDDPASRFVAILSLERITGERMGYDYAAEAEQREPAVVRWVEWFNANADALEAGAIDPTGIVSTGTTGP